MLISLTIWKGIHNKHITNSKNKKHITQIAYHFARCIHAYASIPMCNVELCNSTWCTVHIRITKTLSSLLNLHFSPCCDCVFISTKSNKEAHESKCILQFVYTGKLYPNIRRWFSLHRDQTGTQAKHETTSLSSVSLHTYWWSPLVYRRVPFKQLNWIFSLSRNGDDAKEWAPCWNIGASLLTVYPPLPFNAWSQNVQFSEM